MRKWRTTFLHFVRSSTSLLRNRQCPWVSRLGNTTDPCGLRRRLFSRYLLYTATASTGSSGVSFFRVSLSRHMDGEGGCHEFDVGMET